MTGAEEPPERQLPLWPFGVAVAIAVLGLLAALLWPDPSPSLQLNNPSNNAASAAIPNVPARTPYAMAPYQVCVAHGAVTITSVDFRDPAGGLEIVNWAVAEHHGDYSSLPYRGTAGKADGYVGHVVDSPCSAARYLAVTVQRTADVGRSNGFVVHSSAGTVVVPFALELCATTCDAGFGYQP